MTARDGSGAHRWSSLIRIAPEPKRRQGTIAGQLIAGATAIGEAHPDENVAIIVGSSSHATHRVVGSVAVGLARHSPVPLIIVP